MTVDYFPGRGQFAISANISIHVDNNCSLFETRPDNEYGYGQADPLVFVEIAGKIDPEVSVNWSLEYDIEEVNGTMVPVKPKLYKNDV